MPKSTPRAQVPGSGWFHVVDRLFFTVLVLSLACHFGLIAAVAGRAPEEVDAIDETPRWGGFLPPPFFPKPPLKPKQTGVQVPDSRAALPHRGRSSITPASSA
jgi:hypothetical protein